jgi:phosphomevalonate kinase
MARATAFAPGKLIWLGEYVVLDGAPALVQAVKQGARATACDDASGRLVATSSLWPTEVVLRERGQAVPVPAEAALLPEVVAALEATGIDPARWSGRLDVDSSGMSAAAGGVKFGFGSSAAAAVAAAVALSGAFGGPTGEALAEVAHAAHLAFQRGAGSGIDVETSLRGGRFVFERRVGGVWSQAFGALPGLEVAVLHTGVAANTRTFLAALVEARAARRPGVAEALGLMHEAAAHGARAAGAGDVPGLLGAVRAFVEGERMLTRAGGPPVIDAAVERCLRAAESAGWTAKPSGAGGGDLVVAFCDRPGARADLEAACAREQIALLDPGDPPAGALPPAVSA